MLSIDFLMKVSVAVFSGFIFLAACAECHGECSDVESKTICYFTPNVSLVDWDTAWRTCKELDATLPVILSREGQTVLETYLEKHLPGQPVWTAGRYVGDDNTWKWLNGERFSGTGPSCGGTTGGSCTYGTQAVLTKERRYEARFPKNEYAFICSIPGVYCANLSENHITWVNRCLEWSDNNMLPLNQARNYCLKRGGDLATFSDDGDLDRLQNMRTDLQEGYGYWIGLHRKWWIWNTTRSHDIKYNMLIDKDDLRKDCLFLSIRSEWDRDVCSVNKSVICQRASVTTGIAAVVTTGMTASAATGITATVTIGVVIAVLVVAIAVVTLLIFIKKYRPVAQTVPYGGGSTKKLNPVTPSQNIIVQFDDGTYATIDSDDDVENPSYKNVPNPNTSQTKVEICDRLSAEYSEPIDSNVTDDNRSLASYSEPYSSSSVVTPAPKNLFGSPDGKYVNVCAVEKCGRQQKDSNDLVSHPIKIGPKGDIYTLPISNNS